ncbi:uncharacterized protein LOC107608471 [Arachis ipaensis]|uniref:uncharacterized protein LOC107608471 n=1 Tax=Arachis ipaensis TaxID=130454 RepID=UPI000A2B22B8|nr:uncharacterized protein LOC107608471 [Arachis ipaensis]
MEKGVIDLILVPSGLLVMAIYHFWLLRRVLKHPTKTTIAVNEISRRLWVETMMEDIPRHGVLAVQSLRNNIMASTLLATAAISLSSLIAILMVGGGGGGNYGGYYHKGETKSLVSEAYGDRISDYILSLKFFAMLLCFLLSFMFNVQSIRYYNQASILINVPFKKVPSSPTPTLSLRLGMLNVTKIFNKGSYFWSLGWRAFMWLLGPIPMFVSCIVLVFILYFLDSTFDCGWQGGDNNEVHKNYNVDMEVGMGAN